LWLLITAVPGIMCCRDRRRASWLGFAFFGWGYLILCFAPWFETRVGPYLFSTELLELLYPRISDQTAFHVPAHWTMALSSWRSRPTPMAWAQDLAPAPLGHHPRRPPPGSCGHTSRGAIDPPGSDAPSSVLRPRSSVQTLIAASDIAYSPCSG